MFNKLIHTSRQYLGLPTISGSEKTGTNTTHQVARTLDTTPQNTFNDFLRELVNTTQIHFYSTKDKIDKNTRISTTNNDEIYYSTVWELMMYLWYKINNHSILTDYFERNFVVMTFID